MPKPINIRYLSGHDIAVHEASVEHLPAAGSVPPGRLIEQIVTLIERGRLAGFAV